MYPSAKASQLPFSQIFHSSKSFGSRSILPFSFLEMNPLSNTQGNQSLILSLILNSKGNLFMSVNKIKSSCKAEVTVPPNYHGFLYQLKAFTAAIKIITGNKSVISIKLANLSQSIENIPISTSWQSPRTNASQGRS
jgi:hypothetical protein